jgi:hypothetical protein
MAEIKFYANSIPDGNVEIKHADGSGLGFYGSSFGVAVPVGSQQTTTYITNSSGTAQGTQLHNTALYASGDALSSGEVRINNASVVNLAYLANYHCPLNIRFTHDEPVAVQNCKLRIFDRNNISNPASGVTTWVFESRHLSNLEDNNYTLGLRSSDFNTGEFYWKEFDALTSSELQLTPSPGISGTNTSAQDTSNSGVFLWKTKEGAAHESARHDWYVALSSEPESIGSKQQYGLYFTLEYL